jgi:pentatricopeptide repeat protein
MFMWTLTHSFLQLNCNTDTDDGYVTVTGISDKASPIVRDNIRVGDRVVSVESSLGGKMWQVYNTDALISAVTSRLPGQNVRIRFERVVDVLEEESTSETKQLVSKGLSSLGRDVLSDAVDGFRLAKQNSESAVKARQSSTVRSARQTAAQTMLLSRSRDLLRTYIARKMATADSSVPARVADRVLEAVMEAPAALDGRTLTLIMTAYNSCKTPDKTLQIFEEVFGLAADGTDREAKRIHGGKLSADISALNVFTISALLRAHARRGDYESAIRVLAAMENRTEFSIGGKAARSWSGKGDPLNMLPDTRVYNIALAAAAKRGTEEGILAAIEIFDSMPDPSLNNPPFGTPAKNLVTYNTMIDAYAIQGRYEEANEVYKMLRKSKLRPDSITLTTLIKASIKEGNLAKALDLLDDMKWIGLQPDLVTYNRIIEALCNANRLYEAKDLVNEMELTKVKPDSMTYVLLMTGLLKANKPGPCLTLFESAFSDQRTTALTENVQLYTTAITAAAALGDHERALELVSRMNTAGVKPNKKTLTALMGACIAGKQYSAAVDVFSKIKNPDSYAISVGLKALCYAEKWNEALELINDQKSGQKMLTGKEVMMGYNNLLQRALESGAFSVAREAFVSFNDIFCACPMQFCSHIFI